MFLAPLPESLLGPTVAKMLGRVLSKIPSGKGEGKAVKPNFTHYASRPGEPLPLLQRIVGKGRLKPPPRAGGRSPDDEPYGEGL